MKTSFKLFALLLAVGYPIVAIAQVFGAQLPSSVSTENATVVFSFAVLALIFMSDYGRRNTLSCASRRSHHPLHVTGEKRIGSPPDQLARGTPTLNFQRLTFNAQV